jgi:hypothetical protein
LEHLTKLKGDLPIKFVCLQELLNR